MITIKNVTTIDGEVVDHTIDSAYQDETIDGTGLTMLPALIDPHVHFRIPGAAQKEDWKTAGSATLAGGVTTVLDMPNNTPPTTNRETLEKKKAVIHELLVQSGLPVRYKLWLGATPNNLSDIEGLHKEIVGVKMFMGSSTGNLLVDKREDQEKIFALCARLNIVLAVHAEDEASIQKNAALLADEHDVTVHSKIRNPEVATRALEQVIDMAKKYGTRVYVVHTSTREELRLIAQAKADGVTIFCEATPHHLVLNTNDYARLGTKGQMNPPLRTQTDNDALWEGIRTGTVDTIGTDHAPHRLEEKNKPYGEAPSGVPGIENYLPLLLDAHHHGKISLHDIVRVTHDGPQNIFGIEPTNDVVLVDLSKSRTILDSEQRTKCGWSPYAGMMLQGWPVYTICRGNVYKF